MRDLSGYEGHTPGPWEAAERGDYSDFDGDSSVILGDDRRIAVVQHNGTDECEANAHLIAAAPALAARVTELEARNAELEAEIASQKPYWIDPDMAMHWMDRYAAGVDDQPQLTRIIKCVGIARAKGEVA